MFLSTNINTYNILVISLHPGKSQFISFVELYKGLARKKHNITVINYFPLPEKITNYRDITIGEHTKISKDVPAVMIEIEQRGTFYR